jgi:hypothetical protein
MVLGAFHVLEPQGYPSGIAITSRWQGGMWNEAHSPFRKGRLRGICFKKYVIG